MPIAVVIVINQLKASAFAKIPLVSAILKDQEFLYEMLYRRNLMDDRWQPIEATVIQGHGVASGKTPDKRFPEGSIPLQLPIFQSLGLDIHGLYPATINISIAPKTVHIIKPFCYFPSIEWCKKLPPENFSFFNCRIGKKTSSLTRGFVYYPHPETKTEHHQPPNTLEVIAPWINDIGYGSKITILLKTDEIRI